MVRRLALCALLWAACGDGGAVGDGGIVEGVISPEVGAAACLTATGCGIVRDDISRCTATVAGVNLRELAAAAGVTPDQVRCLAAAKNDCAAARRCLNGGVTPMLCNGATTCNGDVLDGCSEAAGTNGRLGTMKTDCAAFGETCVAADGGVSCGLAACGTQPPACAGDRLRSCVNGVSHELDCAHFSSVCVPGPAPHCRGSGDPCSGSLMNPMRGIRCDGSELIFCFDGQEAKRDCAAAGLSCLPNALGEPFACANGNQCTPATFTASCAAPRLTYCNNGSVTTVDCAKLGFRSCDATTLGTCTIP